MEKSVNSSPEPTLASSPKAGRLLLVVLGTFVALCTLSAFLPHDPYIRYQQLAPTLHHRAVWAYERIVFDQTPIDIAIIGNSRLGAGVSAPVVQNVMSEELGRPVNVVNLSMAQEGRNSHFAVAKLLLEHHPEVKLVVLSAIEEMPRSAHPAFRNIADHGDIVAAPVLIHREYFDDLAFVPFRQMSLWVYSLNRDLFGFRGFTPARYKGAAFDTTASYYDDSGEYVDRGLVAPLSELRQVAQQRVSSITPAVLPQSLADFEYAIEHRYTQDIVKLAEQKGAEVAFLYLPIFENAEPLRQEDFYLQKGWVFASECLADKASLFFDYGHLNHRGARLASEMLGRTWARVGAGVGTLGQGEVASICK